MLQKKQAQKFSALLYGSFSFYEIDKDLMCLPAWIFWEIALKELLPVWTDNLFHAICHVSFC